MIRLIDQKDVVGGTSGMPGEKEKIYTVCFKNGEKRKRLKELDINWKYILKMAFE
jgi:hypothetical protein